MTASDGTQEATKPAPHATMPARPMLSTQASSVWAMVAYAATAFAPDSAAASATCWTSPAREKTH